MSMTWVEMAVAALKQVSAYTQKGTILNRREWTILVQSTNEGRDLRDRQVRTALELEARNNYGCVVRVKSGVYKTREDRNERSVMKDGPNGEPVQTAAKKTEVEPVAKMNCGMRVAKCYQGEKCYMAAECSAARNAGYMTLGELEERTDVATVYGNDFSTKRR